MPVRPPTHKPQRPNTKRYIAPEQARKKTAERGYGYRWQQTAKGWLKANPLCVHCEQRGKITLATEVDHIIPHRGDMAIFWDMTQVQSLCHTCHSIKTGKGL